MEIGDHVVIVKQISTKVPIGTVGRINYKGSEVFIVAFKGKHHEFTQYLGKEEIELLPNYNPVISMVSTLYKRQRYVHNIRH